MQFTQGIGITITKEELEAALTFADYGEQGHVSFRIRDGKLLCWASDAGESVYHRGFAFDGSGKPFKHSLEFELVTEALGAIARSMQAGEEVVLHTNRLNSMTGFGIREIESSEWGLSGSLDGKVSEQLCLDLPFLVPDEPPHTPFAVRSIHWSSATLKSLDKVAKASGKGSCCKFWIPGAEEGLTYIEIDTARSFADGEQARWLVIIPAVSLNPFVPRGRKSDGDDRQEPLFPDHNATHAAATPGVRAAAAELRKVMADNGASIVVVPCEPETEDETAAELKRRSKNGHEKANAAARPAKQQPQS